MNFEEEQPNQESETKVESRKLGYEEIKEKITSELTKELENDEDSLWKELKEKEDSRGDVKFERALWASTLRIFGAKTEEIKDQMSFTFSLNEEKREQFKEFLEKEKQESEPQSKELNELYENLFYMIKVVEENEKKVEEKE